MQHTLLATQHTLLATQHTLLATQHTRLAAKRAQTNFELRWRRNIHDWRRKERKQTRCCPHHSSKRRLFGITQFMVGVPPVARLADSVTGSLLFSVFCEDVYQVGHTFRGGLCNDCHVRRDRTWIGVDVIYGNSSAHVVHKARGWINY